MESAGLLPNEAVAVWNVNNGERFETYTVSGQAGSGVVCINGAAAHKVSVGDLVIIAAFGWMEDEQAAVWKPRVVFVDDRNRQVDLERKEEAGGQAHLRKVFG
jgi:aspartate 1-decarboxylase